MYEMIQKDYTKFTTRLEQKCFHHKFEEPRLQVSFFFTLLSNNSIGKSAIQFYDFNKPEHLIGIFIRALVVIVYYELSLQLTYNLMT